MAPSSASDCPQCGAGLPADAPRGLCPRCLVRAGQALAMLAPAPGVAAPTAPGLPLPCTFGNYELLEEVARGGMGIVYKARQKGLGRLVAVKMILTGRFASREFLRRFQAEAQTIARLRHPHIVSVHEIGDFDGQPFFSMDYIDGRNLAQVIGEIGYTQLGFDRAARWMRTIALAVDHAHAQGVLHRDLKPANILIDATDEPRVTDFGLAKRVGNDLAPGPDAVPVSTDDAFNSLTLSGQMLGSPSYTPPEQAAGRHDEIGPASDVYALGAIFYHLLTGRPPFAAASLASTITQVLQTEPLALRLLNPSVPGDLETICLKCLEKEPRRRYPTARELAEEIGRFQRNEPIVARPVGPVGRIWRWARRQPTLAIVTGALVVSVLTGFTGILWQLQRVKELAHEQSTQRQRAEAAANRLELERAEELFNQDDAPAALSYLTRVLRRDPAHPVAAARLLSALSLRNFALPLGEPIRTTNRVNWVRFSPDETRAVLACFDGTAQVWDLRNGRPITPLLRHAERVRYADFSPDGTRVVTASADRTTRVWDAATGEPLTPPLEHDLFVNTARFSQDGEWIVTGADDKTARVWNARTGEPAHARVLRLSESAMVAEFSPDGRHVLTGDRNGVAQLWNSQTGEAVGGALTLSEDIRSGAFSPDGRRLALGGYKGTVQIWEVATGRSEGKLPKLEGAVQCVEFSPEGLRLLTAAANSVRLWDALTRQPVSEPIRHPSLVTSAQFSRDGRRLLISSYDTPVRLWDVTPGQMLATLVSGQGRIADLAFSPDGRTLALGAADWAQAWELKSRKTIGPRHRLPRSTRQIQFSPDGLGLLVVMNTGICDGWDLETGFERFPRFSRGPLVNGPASADGELVVVEGHDATTSLAAGPGSQNTATIWNLRTGRPVTPPMAHRNDVDFSSFSPDGRKLATASHDTTARVWDVRSGQPLTPPLAHDRHVNRARFSRDSQWVITASDDASARVWDLRGGGALWRRFNHDAAVQDADFSPNGTRAVTVSGCVVQVWDLFTGRAFTEPLVHAQPVLQTRFSPDGRVVATASDDELRLWDVGSSLPISEPLRHRGIGGSFVFSPDGRWLASASQRQAAHLLELPCPTGRAPDWLIELAEIFAGRRLDRAMEVEAVTWQHLFALRRALTTNTTSDEFSRWGRWFLADRQTRPLSPSSPLTAVEYFRRCEAEPSLDNVLDALQWSPTNTTLLESVGLEMKRLRQTLSPRQLEVADRLTWHAFRMHSNALVMVRARAETLYGIGQSSAAMELVEQWLALAPDDRDALELRGRLHADAQRWAEAWADLSRPGLAESNRELRILRTDCFQRAFASELKSSVAREGKSVKLCASLQPSIEIAWQWQRDGADIPGATAALLHFPALAETDFGRYRVTLRHRSGEIAISPTVLVRAQPVAASVTGHWDFDEGTLAATVGHDLEFFDGPRGETAKRTLFGTTTELGVSDIGGRPARVMRFPPASPTMGYLLRHAALANGGGRRVNRYTLIMDALIPALHESNSLPGTTPYTAIFQTSLQNENDGELYLEWHDGRAKPGVATHYGGSTLVTTGQWHRLVAAIDLSAPAPVMSKYVDGRKHADETMLHDAGAGNLPEGLDGRFSLSPAIILFADDDGETTAGYVNSIQFHNERLTDEQIAALGGPSAEGIPLMIPASR